MTGLAPSLVLTREQASRLHRYLQTYRRYALTSLMPCAGRNTTLRILQTMQGRLLMILDQSATLVSLLLTMEEMTTLQAIISALLVLYAQRPASIERDTSLVDLAALKTTLKRY